MELESFPFFSSIKKRFWLVINSLNIGRLFQDLDISFLGFSKLWTQSYLIGLFKWPVSYWMNCDSLCFLRTGPFLPSVEFMCAKLFTILPYYSFHILGWKVIVSVLFLLSAICIFSVLPFWVLLEVCQILSIFPNNYSLFINFCSIFLFPTEFKSVVFFTVSFLLLAFGLYWSLPRFLRWDLDYWLVTFSFWYMNLMP